MAATAQPPCGSWAPSDRGQPRLHCVVCCMLQVACSLLHVALSPQRGCGLDLVHKLTAEHEPRGDLLRVLRGGRILISTHHACCMVYVACIADPPARQSCAHPCQPHLPRTGPMPTRERRTFVCATTCCSSRMVTCTSCARYSSSCAQPCANVSAPSQYTQRQTNRENKGAPAS